MLAVDVPIESVNQCTTFHPCQMAVEIQRPQTGSLRRGQTLHDLDQQCKTLVAKPLLRFSDSIFSAGDFPCVVHQTPRKSCFITAVGTLMVSLTGRKERLWRSVFAL